MASSRLPSRDAALRRDYRVGNAISGGIPAVIRQVPGWMTLPRPLTLTERRKTLNEPRKMVSSVPQDSVPLGRIGN
jgi:hypothetical protein